MLRYDVPTDDPNFGKMYRCPNNAQDVDLDWQARLRGLSNLQAFKDKIFDNFTYDGPTYTENERHSLKHALHSAKNFVQNPKDRWLLLEGLYGTGKTHLAAAVGNAFIDQGEAVLFITTPDLLDHLRSSYGPTSEIKYDDLFDRVRNAPLLILDDLGVENPSPWAQEKLFQIINYRYVTMLPTVITTNTDLEKVDRRISSRMMDTNIITRVIINAPDYRSISRTEQEKLRTNLNLYANMTFDNFDIYNHVTPDEQGNLRRVAAALEDYAQHPEGWIFLHGRFGTGKTHLAASIAHERQRQGDKVMFLTAPDLLDYLRVTFGPNATTTFDQRLNELREADMLIIDDLGTESATPWAKEKLFQLLDYRYLTRAATVITTSQIIIKIDKRIQTRIMDERVCVQYILDVRSYAFRLKGIFPKNDA